jgi:hypothetical protein
VKSQIRFGRLLVKEDGLHESGCLPSTSAPSAPLSRGNHEEPATVLTALPPRAGFRRSFASCAHSRGHPFEAERLDPDALERGPSAARRLLQSNNPRARLLDRLNPDQRPRKLPPGCASREAPPMVLTRWRRSSSPERACDPSEVRGDTSRGVTGQGLAWLSPSSAPRRDCSRRELCPNPIGSDTSCRDLVAPPAGEAGVAGHPCWTGVGYELTQRTR